MRASVELLLGVARGCAFVADLAVAGFPVEAVELVVDKRAAEGGGGGQQPFGNDAGLDGAVVPLAALAAEAVAHRVGHPAQDCLPVGRLPVADQHDVAVAVVGLHDETFGQARIVEVDLLGRMPYGVELIEHVPQSALLDILAHAVFVGQLRPARVALVQHEPHDLFVERLRVLQIGFVTELLLVAQAEEFFPVVGVSAAGFLQHEPFVGCVAAEGG